MRLYNTNVSGFKKNFNVAPNFTEKKTSTFLGGWAGEYYKVT